MKKNLLFVSVGLLFSQCKSPKIPQATGSLQNNAFRIKLNQTMLLTGENKRNLGEITFTHLDESRCPAKARCVRQGAAVTFFALRTEDYDAQHIRLFIGDFMANDSRNRRNLTADTVVVQLKDKNRYQLILTAVVPYPRTSGEAAVATFLLKRP